MRTKKGFTIVEQAIAAVPEFTSVVTKLGNQVELRGQSKSTLNNYIRRIALFVLHFKQLPETLSEDEIQEYLVTLARDPKFPSRSSFKHHGVLAAVLLSLTGPGQASDCPALAQKSTMVFFPVFS